MEWLGLWWPYAALAAVLAAAAITDVRTGRIPNVVTYPAIALGLVGHAIAGGIIGRTSLGLDGAAAGFAVGFGPMLLAWMAGGIGGGDAKLLGAVGALTGWRFTLAAMFCGFAAAGLLAVVVMVQKRIVWRTLGRVLRFLYLLVTPARATDPATPESPKVPFGLALCIGAAAAMLDLLLDGPITRRLFGA